jgi:HNH endonuclease
MEAGTRRFVRERAGERFEYCRLDQRHSEARHHIDHIVAKQHGGMDVSDNLALARHRCNLRKGPNLTGIDPADGVTALLFHPRLDRWADHFVLHGGHIEGLTASGRATVQVLRMHDSRQVELRLELLRIGELT